MVSHLNRRCTSDSGIFISTRALWNSSKPAIAHVQEGSLLEPCSSTTVKLIRHVYQLLRHGHGWPPSQKQRSPSNSLSLLLWSSSMLLNFLQAHKGNRRDRAEKAPARHLHISSCHTGVCADHTGNVMTTLCLLLSFYILQSLQTSVTGIWCKLPHLPRLTIPCVPRAFSAACDQAHKCSLTAMTHASQ